jgi:hypothetical protein
MPIIKKKGGASYGYTGIKPPTGKNHRWLLEKPPGY